MISVVLLGAGNVASHLYNVFSESDATTVTQWYSRSLNAITHYNPTTKITDSIETLFEADMYILAISDDAIAEVSQCLPFSNRFVVHTSGSVGLHDLDKKNTRGVFYPLQSFSKERMINFEDVPICIESEDKSKLELLKTLAQTIGSPVYKINTEQRRTLHLSAVFVNNFTNQLYRIAHEISDAKHINFDILKPLILETAQKVQEQSPYMSQTGPAKRNDKKTIKRHLKGLENEYYKDIYMLLTESIQHTHGIHKYPKSKSVNY